MSKVRTQTDHHAAYIQTRKAQIENIPCEIESTRYSSSSKASSVLSQKYAKAEAAKARAVIAQKEASLRKQCAQLEEQQLISQATTSRKKADLETDLLLLHHEKEAAAALAEAESLAKHTDTITPPTVMPAYDPVERVREFVKQQKHSQYQENPTTNTVYTDPIVQPNPKIETQPMSTTSSTMRQKTFQPLAPDFEQIYSAPPVDTAFQPPVPVLSPEAIQHVPQPVDQMFVPDFEQTYSVPPPDIVFQPSASVPPPEAGRHLQQPIDQITKFLLRKDLAMSRLSYFNDKPEEFHSWKDSFRTVCTEMGVSAAEEVDLLVKWLGPESRQYAISIRSACSNNPTTALYRIWERLEDRYGTVENIHQSIMQKLKKFPKITSKENSKLFELSDLLAQLESLKENPKFSVALSYFDSSVGVGPVVDKLPHNLQEKWVSTASVYKNRQNVAFPPFTEFVKFVRTQAKIRNDPGLIQPSIEQPKAPFTQEQKFKAPYKNNVSSRKTGITRNTDQHPTNKPENICSLHKTNTHSLLSCRAFGSKTIHEKRKFLKDEKLCYKCFLPDHVSKDCRKMVTCDKCGKPHNTIMHMDTRESHGGESAQNQGREEQKVTPNRDEVSSSSTNSATQVTFPCTEICGSSNFTGKSCAKICLVRASSPETGRSILSYAIIDDQSNRSLARPELFESLQLPSSATEYTLNSCNGQRVLFGRVADCLVESIDGSQTFELRSMLECEDIPNTRHEIPTPDVAKYHPHLVDIAKEISPINPAEIYLLIGRDVTGVHRVLDQRFGPRDSPYAQKLPLGLVIVGETCIGTHLSNTIVANKTYLLPSGRRSIFEPCPNVKTVVDHGNDQDPVFERRKDDEMPSLSRRQRIYHRNGKRSEKGWL